MKAPMGLRIRGVSHLVLCGRNEIHAQSFLGTFNIQSRLLRVLRCKMVKTFKVSHTHQIRKAPT